MIVDADRLWRLNNLYSITDKVGRKVPFRLNWAQQELVEALHFSNVILKARQLGFTTFIQLLMLDGCLFTPNVRAGTVAHTLGDAQVIFRDKVKFPYDNLEDGIKARAPLVSANASELMLANNSSIRVATSMRGGTLQYLHISEYGKLCAKFPEKAREVRTGALNTLQAGNIAFIESTAEGQEGHFFEICSAAQSRQRMGTAHSPLDFKFHFFPWWRCPDYVLKPVGAEVPNAYQRYFEKLAETGIELSDGQKAWYVAKAETQLAEIKREYPSTAEEAFEAAVEGAYYADQIAAAELQGRIGEFAADERVPVDTVWDLGFGDYTAIWFAQLLPDLRRRLVGYYQNSGEGMLHYVDMVRRMARERGWKLGDHYLPQDAWAHEWSSGRTRSEHFKDAMHVYPRRVPQESVEDGINAVRQILGRCEFDEAACSEGLKALRAYRREWDDERGIYRDRPRHDWASHGADAFRYFALLKRDPRAEPISPKPPPAFAWYAGKDGMMRSPSTILQMLEETKRKRLAAG